MRRIIMWILTIALMGFIFYMSAQDADTSGKHSSSVGWRVACILHSDFEEWPLEKQIEYVERIDHPVRKVAHGLEYMLLGMLLTGAIMPVDTTLISIKTGIKGISFAKPLCIGVAYAISDEVHQRFVPGRSCQFTDVCIDSGGVLAGVIAAFILFYIVYMIKNK